jgi:hypothetical protein
MKLNYLKSCLSVNVSCEHLYLHDVNITLLTMMLQHNLIDFHDVPIFLIPIFVNISILSLHIRLEDVSRHHNLTIYLTNALQTAALAYTEHHISLVYIATNGNKKEKQQMFQTFPQAYIECDDHKLATFFHPCHTTTIHPALISQVICIEAEQFIGTPISTFSDLINNFRINNKNKQTTTSAT